MTIVYKSEATRGYRWQALCAEQAPEHAFHVWPDQGQAEEVRYLIAWQPPDDLMARFPKLEVLFSIGAGVDQLDLKAIPADLPVVRMIDPGLTQGMVEYVTCAVLALQRDLPAYLRQQRDHEWQPLPQRTASSTHVGVMGLGELGQAVLEQLNHLGFRCEGWNRSPRALADVRVHSGPNELSTFLSRTDILICLLPLTPQTHGLLNSELFKQLPQDAALVHVGRGTQLVPDDLLDCLDHGRLRAAILDVVDPEPLPAGHPIWNHPRIWLTPHIASATQSDSAFGAILQNIRRFEAGQPMSDVIDRECGY